MESENHLPTDGLCMHHWVSDILSGQTRVRTKAPSEMLFRHWLVILRELAAEYKRNINVGLVKSHNNEANKLTRVPWQWLEEICTVTEPKETMCALAEELDVTHIQAIHQSSGHPGMKRTLYLVKLVYPSVPKAVMQDCRECQYIDPAPVHWKPGRLDVSESWSTAGINVTHFVNKL